MDLAKTLINALDPKYILKQENKMNKFGKSLTKKFHNTQNRIKSSLQRGLNSTKRKLKKPNIIPTNTNTPITLASNTKPITEKSYENPMRSKT